MQVYLELDKAEEAVEQLKQLPACSSYSPLVLEVCASHEHSVMALHHLSSKCADCTEFLGTQCSLNGQGDRAILSKLLRTHGGTMIGHASTSLRGALREVWQELSY